MRLRPLIFAALTALAIAQPADAELDGPVAVVDRTHPTVATTPDGFHITTYPAVSGVHLICTPGFFSTHADVLTPYLDTTQTDLEAVYAGDDPAHPTMTVALTFPDQAAADAVKAQVMLTP